MALDQYKQIKKSNPTESNPTPQEPAKPAPTPVEAPISTPRPANLEPTCPAPGVFQAVDLSEPCTQHFLDTMKYLGIKTVLRYYDYEHETLKGKTPKLDELALIKRNGFQVCMVFQHSNNSIATFQAAGRGLTDAKRSLELANGWGQPKGSGIYFGVDFDPTPGEFAAVRKYAEDFSRTVRDAGFRVGAYGSGFTLNTLLDAKIIDLAWLSMSTGFRDSKAFAASNRWNLHQVKDRDCGGINCDFDYAKPDFGQWTLP